jgi:enoyl-CoA hydratase/carnithine racemase
MNNDKNTVIALPDTLKTSIHDEILIVTIHRPEKRNALNDEIMKGIEKIFSSIPEGVKCAIIRGEGNNFSSGLDLTELKERNALEGLQHSRIWYRAVDALRFGKVPVIAVLNGVCFGGGLEMASACHIRVAEKSVVYALPEGQRGIFVGGGGSVRLPKIIGIARMTDMMLTGRAYTGDEGNLIGISQYLVEDGEGFNMAIELAKKISYNAEISNYAIMHVLPRIDDASHDQGLMLESLMAAIAQSSPEAKDRINLFLEGNAKKIS